MAEDRFAHFTGIEEQLLVDQLCLAGDEAAGKALADYYLATQPVLPVPDSLT